jgi:hypothetical protein
LRNQEIFKENLAGNSRIRIKKSFEIHEKNYRERKRNLVKKSFEG